MLLTDDELDATACGESARGKLSQASAVAHRAQNAGTSLHDAYQHRAFRENNYAVLMTGPSGSADIGGTTVHPAQGVMTLTVILWPVGQPDAKAQSHSS